MDSDEEAELLRYAFENEQAVEHDTRRRLDMGVAAPEAPEAPTLEPTLEPTVDPAAELENQVQGNVASVDGGVKDIYAATPAVAVPPVSQGPGAMGETENAKSQRYRQQMDLRRIPRQGDFITVVDDRFGRVHVPLRPEPAGGRTLSTAAAHHPSGVKRRHLLGVPIESLLDEAQRLDTARAVRASEMRESQQASQASAAAGETAAAPQTQLWTDKYKPRNIVDIICDEHSIGTNRRVLEWVQSWKPVVFGSNKNAFASQGDSASSQQTQTQTQTQTKQQGSPRVPRLDKTSYLEGHRTKNNAMKRARERALQSRPDDPRPAHKILLLAGAPGVGKTTIAHLVARHCGYKVIEVNASDERAGTVLLNRIRDGTENTDVSGDKRPNLLVLDEIDGAWNGASEAGSAISTLVKIAKAPYRQAAGPKVKRARGEKDGEKKGGDSDDEGGDSDLDDDDKDANDAATNNNGKKKKGKTYPSLKRPIICICNDPHKPVLRALKEVALVIDFRAIRVDPLAEALRVICRREGLDAPQASLRQLVARAGSDVRSCLNTLQFVRRRTTRLTAAHLATLPVGGKDMSRPVFQAWDMIFSRAKPSSAKSRAGSRAGGNGNGNGNGKGGGYGFSGGGSGGSDSEPGSVPHMLHLLPGACETSLLLGALHHNHPHLLPSSLPVTSHLADLLCSADLLSARPTGLTAQLAAATALLFRDAYRRRSGIVRRRPRSYFGKATGDAGHSGGVDYPKQDAESARRARESRAVAEAVVAGVAPRVRGWYSPRTLCVDVASHAVTALAPGLRPLSANLMTPREKGELAQTIDTMLSMGLSYVERRGFGENGWNSGHVLNPALDKLVVFGGDPGPRRTLSQAVRQIISHETMLEWVRRQERREETKRTRGAAAAIAEGEDVVANDGGIDGEGNDANDPGDKNQQQLTPVGGKNLGTPGSAGSSASGFALSQVTPAPAAKRALGMAAKAADLAATKKESPSERGPVDFFGRPVKRAAGARNGGPVNITKGRTRTQQTPAGPGNRHLIHLKWQEGLTNAVRRTVRMSDFL